MKFSRWLGLLIISILFWVIPASAHGGITIDGYASDWANLGNGSCPSAPGQNSGSVLDVTHTDCGLGSNAGMEYVWTDATGDQRTDHWGGTGNMDLTQLRITGDSTNLYFFLRFSDITNCNAQYIAVAINSDDSSGTTFFPDNADTNLGNFGNGYERVVVANTNKTGYFTNNTTYTSGGSSYCVAANDLWEIAMPISALGLNWPANSGAYDFSVAIFCHNGSGGICDVSGNSDAMDVVTTVSGNTWNEVSDSSLDYNFSMGFGPNATQVTKFRNLPSPAVMGFGGLGLLGLAGFLYLRRRR